MQMSSGDRNRTAHWAYMLQTRPGEPSWDSLPGVGLSAPEMLEGTEAPQAPIEQGGRRPPLEPSMPDNLLERIDINPQVMLGKPVAGPLGRFPHTYSYL